MNSSFLIKSFSFLFGALSFILIPKSSFAQQSFTPKNIELKCSAKEVKGDLILYVDFKNKNIIDMQSGEIIFDKMLIAEVGIVFYSKNHPFITNERLTTILGFPPFSPVFSLERKNLDFALIGATSNTEYPSTGTKFNPFIVKGICSMYKPSAPSSKKNLI